MDWDAFSSTPGKNPAGAIRNALMLDGEPAQLEIGVEVLSYRPELRCALRYRIGGRMLVGKLLPSMSRVEEMQRTLEGVRRAAPEETPPLRWSARILGLI